MMTDEQFHDLWNRFSWGPYRVFQRILWVDYNEDAVVKWGRRHGHRPSFWCFTVWDGDKKFTRWDTADLARCRKDWSKVLGRLIQMYPDLCGVRFFEFGTKNGRWHVHVVFDRELPLRKVKKCLRGTVFGKEPDVEPVRDENLGGYLWKDMSKGSSEVGVGRRFAAFGIFEDKTRLDDIVIDCHEREVLRNALATRVPGESFKRVLERAMWMYWHEPWMNHTPESLRSVERQLAEYFGVDAPRGEAYEEAGGSTDFDVGKAA